MRDDRQARDASRRRCRRARENASASRACRPAAGRARRPPTSAPTRAGSSPNDRMLITGLRGLLLTSATGAKLTCTPSARPSIAGDACRPRTPAARRRPRRTPSRAETWSRRRCRMPHAPLEVRRGQQRQRRDRLQPIEDRRQLQRLAEHHRAVGGLSITCGTGSVPPNAITPPTWRFVHERDQRVVTRRIGAGVGGVEAGA